MNTQKIYWAQTSVADSKTDVMDSSQIFEISICNIIASYLTDTKYKGDLGYSWVFIFYFKYV